MSSAIKTKAEFEATDILTKVNHGATPHSLGGKRLLPGTSRRNYIKFNLIGQHRLIVYYEGNVIWSVWIGSH